MRSLFARLTACFTLILVFSFAHADTGRSTLWQSVIDQVYEGQPVLALNQAKSCASQNVFCAKYVELQQWAMAAEPETASSLQALANLHASTFATALHDKMPDAVILNTWLAATAMPVTNPERDAVLSQLQPLLDEDNRLAWYVAGLLRSYEHGDVRSRDGLPFLVRASELGVREAMVKVAQVLACRKCAGEPDDAQAYFWLNQAIIMQYAPAMTEMGRWLRIGYVWPKNVQQAEAYLKQATLAGDTNALCEQAKMALHGDGMSVQLIQAKVLFRNGLVAGGQQCASYLAEAYDERWLKPEADENETTYYRACALQGNVNCAVQWGRETMYANDSVAVDENVGVAVLQSLVTVLPKAGEKLGDFLMFRKEPGSKRNAYDALRQAELLGSNYARYRMVTLLIDHKEVFTADELSRLPELFETTLKEVNQSGFAYSQAHFYARGIYHEQDAQLAQRWLWAALYSVANSDRKKLLKLAEAEKTFIDDEAMKWAYRSALGIDSKSVSRVEHYIDRLQNGHNRQKVVAFREMKLLEDSTELNDLINAAFALAYSDPELTDIYEPAQFKQRVQALLAEETKNVTPELYYELGKRAHLSSYQIKDQPLARLLFERSDERANGLLVRLLATDKFSMVDEAAAQLLLEKIVKTDTRYLGSFYRELAGYADRVNRLDLADTFYQKALLTGDVKAKRMLIALQEKLAQEHGLNYREYLIEKLQTLDDVSVLSDEQALAVFFTANRLQNLDVNDEVTMPVVVTLYDQLLTHDNRTVQILVHDAYGWLYYVDNAGITFNPLAERAHLTHCIDQPICEEERVFRLAVNLVQYEPIDAERAKSLVEGRPTTISNSLSDLLHYYAIINDADSWWQSLLSSSDYKRDSGYFVYYARNRPKAVSREDIWQQLFSYKKSLDGHVFSLKALMYDRDLLPVNEEERQQIRLMINGSGFEDDVSDYLLGGGA